MSELAERQRLDLVSMLRHGCLWLFRFYEVISCTALTVMIIDLIYNEAGKNNKKETTYVLYFAKE